MEKIAVGQLYLLTREANRSRRCAGPWRDYRHDSTLVS